MRRELGTRGIGVAAAGFATFINLYAPQSVLPTLAAEFHTSLAHTGLTVTATLVAIALVAPFVGGISDALGRRRLILGAAFLLTAPTLGAAVAPTFEVLVACRFAQGLLLPFIFAVTVAYIADECDGAEAVRATGTYAVGTIVGGFAGRFITGWAADLMGWRAGFMVLAALTLALAFLIAATLPAELRFRPVQGWRGSLAGYRAQLRNEQVLATCVVGFTVLFSVVATFTYANYLMAGPPYFLGPAALGSVFVVYLLGAVSTPLAGRAVLRLGRRTTVWLAIAAASLGLLLTLSAWLPLIIAGLALVALGIFTEQVLSIGYVAIVSHPARSTGVGLYVTSYYVGGALGGVAPGWIWMHLGWPGCVALGLAVQGVAFLVTWLAWPPGRPLL